jgi:hypothetical protein
MRSLAIFVIILLVIVGAGALYVVVTTPHEHPAERVSPALIRQVPADAEWFAIVPHAAALDGRLRANPVTTAAIERWHATQRLPQPWMLGNSDLIAWKSGGAMHYSVVGLDAMRALVVRLAGRADILAPPGGATDAALVDLASKLPPGDALVVQREGGRGAYPPIARPAATSVEVTRDEIKLTSVAAGFSPPDGGVKAAAPQFPNGAVLSAAFASPPRVVGDLDRLFGSKVSGLFTDGGMLCIYDVDSRKLLPRPLGVIAIPNTPERQAEIASLKDFAHTGEKDGMLLVSFDQSIDQYQKDVFEQPATVGNEWTLRIDAPRLVPILNDFQKNVGARLVAPRLYRSARDLDQWIAGLEQAKLIDAAASVESGTETLRVRIASK